MHRPSTATRALINAAMVGLIGAAGAAPMQAASAADPPEPSGTPKTDVSSLLGSHDQDLLADAVAAGARRVTLLVAADRGATATVAAAVDRLGGTVSERFEEVGYLRVSLPTGKVMSAARAPGVTAVDLDEVLDRPDPRLDTGRAAQPRAVAPAGPGAGTPDANPYLPTRETGAVAFKRSHPRWDGRGITIGVLDSGVDLDHPALQETSTGERKIVDWVTATDPVVEGDLTWRPMLTEVTGPQFTTPAGDWTAPAGDFGFNVFRESITEPSEPAGDVNRDGDTTDTWGILYRASDNAIWVDTDQDLDFTDETLMRPYRDAFQVSHLGTDDPDTALVEQSPFVVEFREDVDLSPYGGEHVGQVADFVNIGLVEDAHGSHVAGIAAANDLFGGSMDGAAPGARIVSSRGCTWGGGCTAAALTTGMVDLVVNRGVDVVNMSIGGLPPLNDANNARAELYDRLISDHGVQLFLSAGNSGSGLNTVGDPSVTTDVVSVAASVSKATWFANYGAVVQRRQSLFPFSSRGPREDGGFKPNLTAPGSAVSTVPQWLDQPDVVEAGYTLPVGYAMFNGTSMASPQAAGAAALLLSAALSTDRDVTPAQLRRALYTAADFRRGIPANGQGNGVSDVDGAWRLLRTGAVSTRGYRVDASVCTPISDVLASPHRGAGVYNRCGPDEGGHRAGQSKAYVVRVTRTTGPDRAVRHTVRWLGNDGTWSSARSVRLPLGRSRSIVVRARPGAGAHAAIMRLDDPRTRGVDTEVMNTVVAAVQPRRPTYARTWTGRVRRTSATSHFVDVAPGTSSLQLNLTGVATGSQTRMVAINPYGVPVDPTASTACYTGFSDVEACNPNSRAVEEPLPGVWEIAVEARRTSRTLDNPYRLTATAQKVTVTPETVELPSVAQGEPTEVVWSVRNDLAPVTVTREGGTLGSAASRRPSIADGAGQQFEVEVPAGASRLDVSIGSPSDLGADLDLYVSLDGVDVGYSADGDSEESVTLEDPEPGTYTVLVDGYDVPAGSTAYDYRDVFVADALGSLSVPDGQVDLDGGESVDVTGSVVALEAPAEGRELFGELTVRTDQGAVVGRSYVVVGRVVAAGRS